MVSKELERLLEEARNRPIFDEERRLQRISFAYGNTKIENDHITREMVEEQADYVDRRLYSA